MALSKAMYSCLGFYFEQLFEHPVRTRCVSASIIALSANYTSQKLSGKSVKPESLFAYGLYGLSFGGSLPHYFYKLIANITPDNRYKAVLEFLLERLMFTPIYVAISLFFLSLFEGKSVDECTGNVFKLYLPILKANWSYLSLPYFLNFTMVPPVLRVLVMNFIGFCWVVYIATIRRRANQKKEIRDMASK